MKEKMSKINTDSGSESKREAPIQTGESASDSQVRSCPVNDHSNSNEEGEESFNWKPRDFKRWMLAGLGVVCVGLGALGTIVPGLPTTIFVIIAAWSFSKSCPWLEQKLLRNKMFGPSMEIIDGKRPFTRKARGIAMGMMFFFGFSSIGFLHYTNAVPQYVLLIIFLALIAGAISIVKFNPRSNAQSQHALENEDGEH
jgi:uncharacterized protein